LRTRLKRAFVSSKFFLSDNRFQGKELALDHPIGIILRLLPRSVNWTIRKPLVSLWWTPKGVYQLTISGLIFWGRSIVSSPSFSASSFW
jgi:hypothetical protein